MVDLSELVNEISPDHPCGPDLEYDSVRLNLNTIVQGTPEDQFSGQKYEPPNWREVQKQALALLQKSKDLQVYLYLIRAIIHLEGISGFRDCLVLLEKTLNFYWPTVYPSLDPDDGDATQRLNILEELCSMEFILNPLSQCPLVESKTVGRFNLRDIHYAIEKVPVPAGVTKADPSIIKAVFNENDSATLLATYQAIQESQQLLQQIEQLVAANVTGIGNGVNLDSVKSLLKDMCYQFEQFAGDKLVVEEVEAEEVDDGEGSLGTEKRPGKSASRGLGEINSRHDVIKTLDILCKYYAEYEPSSPVPILLKRAKTLAAANFIEIMQNLAPDALAQIQTIKGPDTESN